MKTPYNRIAGQSLERLAALSDGIFAVAMTLLVLDLRVPVLGAIHVQHPLWTDGALASERALWDALVTLVPRLLPYALSFLTLGMFWVGQQTQLNHCAHTDRTLTWLHLAFLLGISLVPFTTGLLAEHITYRLALLIYWLNLLGLGGVLFASLRYAHHAGLMKGDISIEVRCALERRIVAFQALYAISVLLCAINTYVSIALILALQLHSAIAPRSSPISRW